ncbi:hypothetical protein H920_10378 [Fukomys damarensis]|uniref:Uncharacterized protein n=1 Tax=Fukomys damarensis TaxID=885580 RepID=A0A091DZK3_FUKDA|nr:hypothetical protein H920_10378 [Fukomys damarensis]
MRPETFLDPGRRLKTTKKPLALGLSLGRTPGAEVTAALYRATFPGPPKITPDRPIPEVPGEGQMVPFNRTVPFCWGPKERPGQFT